MMGPRLGDFDVDWLRPLEYPSGTGPFQPVCAMKIERFAICCTRRGAASIDYILGIGIILPMMVVLMPQARKVLRALFEFNVTIIQWPWM